MRDPSTSRDGLQAAGGSGPAARPSGALARVAGPVATAILNCLLTKPIAIFAWWLASGANCIEFRERAALRRRVERARREGRPVLFASNHVSMFDDPVVPMALYRTGARAAAELGILVGLALAAVWLPRVFGPAAVVFAVGTAVWGARKTWWSLVDLVNFSGVDGLRGRIEAGRGRPIGAGGRLLLAIADLAIYFFMHSGTVKTVFVDRRAGKEAKQTRARAVEQTIGIAARAEPIWLFFEGGRAKVPGEIGPARRGIGDVVLGLRARGLDPLVVAVHQRGLERVIPRGSRRWLTSGHRIEVCWSELDLPAAPAAAGDPQDVADVVREEVIRIGAIDRGDEAAGA